MKIRKYFVVFLILVLLFPSMANAMPVVETTTVVKEDLKTVDAIKDVNLNDLKILPETIEDIKVQAKTQPTMSLASGQWQDYVFNPEVKLDKKKSSDNFQTDLYTGAAQYSYPLNLPEGRNGIAPHLSLQYNSKNQNPFSFLAFSWNLDGIEYIERDARNGIDSVYEDKRFIFSGLGELTEWLLTDSVHGEYRLMVDNGEFYRFFYHNDETWEILDKEGIHYYFALDSSAIEGNVHQIYRWYINKIEDTLGNNCIFEYKKKKGVSLIDKIRYTNFANEDGIYELNFVYSPQVNAFRTYQRGFQQIYEDKLSSIHLKVNNKLVRSYALSYEDKQGAYLLLKSIEERFFSDGNSMSYEALDPVRFDYYKNQETGNWL